MFAEAPPPHTARSRDEAGGRHLCEGDCKVSLFRLPLELHNTDNRHIDRGAAGLVFAQGAQLALLFCVTRFVQYRQ